MNGDFLEKSREATQRFERDYELSQRNQKLREGVMAARRQGVSDDVIVSTLVKVDPRIQQALDQGVTPQQVLDKLSPTASQQGQRLAQIATRGVSEALAPMAGGALVGGLLGGPPGAALGAVTAPLVVPLGDVLVEGSNRFLGTNLQRPSQTISEMIPGPRAETPGERVLEATSGALGGTTAGIRAAQSLVRPAVTGVRVPVDEGLQRVGQELSRAPAGQMVTVPTATAAGETVSEATDNPFLGLGTSLVTAGAMGLRSGKYEGVDPNEMLARSKQNYEKLDNAKFAVNSRPFDRKITEMQINLQNEGYKPGMTMLTGQIDELFNVLRQDAGKPRSINDIVNMRKTIGNVIASNKIDERTRALARQMLDEFDDYFMNIQDRHLVGLNKDSAEFRNVMDAWKDAREDYRKVKKAEVIQDMVERAEIAPSGKEVSLTQSLKNLANNKNRMRFFSPEEQAEIRKAADGGQMVQALRLVGKFAPMTPAAAIFTAVSPYGAFTAGAGVAGKTLATQRRLQQVEQLQNQMLLGRRPERLEGPFRNLPVYTGRAGLNMLAPVVGQQDSENALAR